MADELLDTLNPEQRAAVTNEGGPMLIIAGAGTGKTAVITKRIAWHIREDRAKPNQVLALTFTEKAAGEMEERLDRLLPYGYTDLWVSTFHSFCERMLRRHALEIGLPHDFKILSQTAAWLLLHKRIEELPLKLYRPLGNPTKFLHALLQHVSRSKDEMITPDEYVRFAQEGNLDLDSDLVAPERARLAEIADAYAAIQKIFHEEEAMDFGDLIFETIRLFRERPLVLKKYRDQFKEILVDEFQDTNIAQYELVKLLAGERQQITVVADDDQAIYKFRGASVSNIMTFKRDFPRLREVVLATNYRSRQEILDLAYRVIQNNNPDRLEVQLDGPTKKLVASRGAGGVCTHTEYQTARDEVLGVVQKIITLKSSDPESTWDDFAVLARTNASADPFTRALREAGAPVQNVSSRGLYQKNIILDLIAYLTVLVDPHDSGALYRVLAGDQSLLRHNDLLSLNQWCNRKSWDLIEGVRRAYEIPTVSDEGKGVTQKFLAQLEKHTALARATPPLSVLLQITEENGMLKDLSANEDDTSREDLLYLNALAKRVERFENEHEDGRLADLVREIRLEREAGDEGALPFDVNAGPETVKVMTVHAAKGLEFKYVFLTHLVEQRFPTRDQGEPIPIPDALVREILPKGDVHLEEERRLFYVACTRARDGLYLSSAADYGGARKRKVSRFVAEAGVHTDRSAALYVPQSKAGDKPPRYGHKIAVATPQIPSTFSFSQLKAFKNCPLQYKYAHILRVPVRGKATFSFGKSIHAALQKFFELVKSRSEMRQGSLFDAAPTAAEATLDELLKFYDESWIDDWYGSKEERMRYYDMGKRSLTALYESMSGSIPIPLALEESFSVQIGPYRLKGRIDRVDAREDGSVEIIDYKTGKAKTEDTVDRDQLLIYQIATREVMGRTPSALTYYYVDEGKRVSFLGTEDELLKFKDGVVATIDAIRASDFGPAPSAQTCRHCDFKNICPFAILS